VVTVTAEGKPGISADVTTALQGTTDIRVSFFDPTDTGGLTIDEYDILIYDPSTDSYVEDLVKCDGSAALVKTNMYCDFLVTYLMSTYSYAIGDLVKAKSRSKNTIGWSEYSSPNTIGAVIQTEPTFMNAPSSGSGSTDT